MCSLEADRDQVGSVVPSGVEGASAANGCTPSLGGMEAPGAREVTRIPSVIVPVCVVKCVSAPPCVDETPCVEATPCVSGVFASVPGCVLSSTPCMNESASVSNMVCVSETPRVSVPTCVSGMVCEGNGMRVRTAMRE